METLKIFNNKSVDNSQEKAKIAEYLEDSIRNSVKQYEIENGIHILGADIMFKNDQVFVGMNSIQLEKV